MEHLYAQHWLVTNLQSSTIYKYKLYCIILYTDLYKCQNKEYAATIKVPITQFFLIHQ